MKISNFKFQAPARRIMALFLKKSVLCVTALRMLKKRNSCGAMGLFERFDCLMRSGKRCRAALATAVQDVAGDSVGATQMA